MRKRLGPAGKSGGCAGSTMVTAFGERLASSSVIEARVCSRAVSRSWSCSTVARSDVDRVPSANRSRSVPRVASISPASRSAVASISAWSPSPASALLTSSRPSAFASRAASPGVSAPATMAISVPPGGTSVRTRWARSSGSTSRPRSSATASSTSLVVTRRAYVGVSSWEARRLL